MPTYTVKHPDGRTLQIVGAQPPTKEQLDQIFAATPGAQPPSRPPVQPTDMRGHPVNLPPDVAAEFQRATSGQPGGDVVLGNITNGARAARDFAKGAYSGLASTVFHGGDLIRRGLGMERVINRPEVQAGITAPESTAGRAGRFTEQAAELMIPAGRVARLTRGTGLTARMATQAATTGATAGVQTGGDPAAIATTAAFGGAAPAVSQAASAVGRRVFEILPEKLYAQIFRHADDDLRRAYQSIARGQPPPPSLAKGMLERSVMGSSEDMAVYSLQKLTALETELQTAAARRIMPMPEKQKYVGLLTEIHDRFGQGFFSQYAQDAQALAASLTALPGPMARASDMLKAKRLLDTLRQTSSFRADPVLAPRQEELKVAADLVRATLHKHPVFSTLLKEEKVFIEGLDAIVADATRRQNSSVFSLIDAALGAAGPKGVAAAATVRGARTPQVMTGVAQRLYQTGKSAPAAEPTVRGAAAVGATNAR